MLLATQVIKGSRGRTHGHCEHSLLFVAITMRQFRMAVHTPRSTFTGFEFTSDMQAQFPLANMAMIARGVCGLQELMSASAKQCDPPRVMSRSRLSRSKTQSLKRQYKMQEVGVQSYTVIQDPILCPNRQLCNHGSTGIDYEAKSVRRRWLAWIEVVRCDRLGSVHFTPR